MAGFNAMINKQFLRNYKDDDGNWSIPNPRTYFDIYSQEFKVLSLQEKLNNLGILINEGLDLPQIIMDYCDNKSPHIVDAVKPTLLCFIQYMRWGETIHFTDRFFADMTPVEMALLVQDEITVRSALGTVICSNWDHSIEVELAKCAQGDKMKLIEILTGAEFSKEYHDK